MSDKSNKIVWQDLTVENASEIKDFYCEVIGWTFTEHNMGEYSDYNIIDNKGDTIAGICHNKGSNANIPPQWLNYVEVEDFTESVEKCEALGGKILDGPRTMGKSQFAVIQDPAGAVLAIMGE